MQSYSFYLFIAHGRSSIVLSPNVSPGPAPLILLPPTSGFHKEAIVSEPIVVGWGDA